MQEYMGVEVGPAKIVSVRYGGKTHSRAGGRNFWIVKIQKRGEELKFSTLIEDYAKELESNQGKIVDVWTGILLAYSGQYPVIGRPDSIKKG